MLPYISFYVSGHKKEKKIQIRGGENYALMTDITVQNLKTLNRNIERIPPKFWLNFIFS